MNNVYILYTIRHDIMNYNITFKIKRPIPTLLLDSWIKFCNNIDWNVVYNIVTGMENLAETRLYYIVFPSKGGFN